MTKSLAIKFYRKLREDGLPATMQRVVETFIRVGASWKLKILRRFCEPRTIFTYYYKTNQWRNPESRSGAGSTLEGTQGVRSGVEDLVRKFHIKTVYDAPCGDFNWMRHVSFPSGVKYIGGDIVGAMIDDLQRTYGNESRSFIRTNIITDPFPAADVWICRDCLFHFSYEHIVATLENFCNSAIPYALLTTDVSEGGNRFEHRDIRTGGFRRIDLFAPPFSFPKETSGEFIDTADPQKLRKMCLWTRDQVGMALRAMKKTLPTEIGNR